MLGSIFWQDLGFGRYAPYLTYSTSGVPQTRWAPVGMPLIPQKIINGVFYLYRDRADALAGRDPGGTGFVVQYDGRGNELVPAAQFYAVTNYHVAVSGFWPTIRLNRKDGGVDVIEMDSSEWQFLPGKYDVAAVPIMLDPDVHEIAAVGTQMFAADPKNTAPSDRIGVGDDVFMVGLFADHDGTTVNIPSARFGNISMLPNEKAKIEQTATKYKGISYVIDMHSRPGFSGSPIFVYRTFGSDLAPVAGGHAFEDMSIDATMTVSGGFTRPTKGRLRVRTLFKLLGIHWAQFPERWEIGRKEQLGEAQKLSVIPEGNYVEGFSGMTCVIPAWQILEVLEMPMLKGPRDESFKHAAAGRLGRAAPKLESVPPTSDENPTHQEDFTRLLGAAARKPPQED